MTQTPVPGAGEAADTLGSALERVWSDVVGGGDLWVDLALSAVVIVLVVVLRKVFLGAMERRAEEMERDYQDVRMRYRWSKGTAYAAFAVAAAALLLIWTGGDFVSMGTFLGLLTAGLAIALRDLVANLAGWVFILWRKPFDLGDRIQIAGFAGDVVDIRVLQFTVLEIGNWVEADQSTGRVIHIPNQKVFSDPQANYTAQFEYLWHEIPVLITFESDWKKAKGILCEVAEEMGSETVEEARRSLRRASRKFLIFYRTLTPTVYTTVKDSGVQLTIRYLCEPRERRGTSQAIWEAILERFAEAPEIELAYPTTRFYQPPSEGPGSGKIPSGPGPDAAGEEPTE